jgi:hypothetical protein
MAKYNVEATSGDQLVFTADYDTEVGVCFALLTLPELYSQDGEIFCVRVLDLCTGEILCNVASGANQWR